MVPAERVGLLSSKGLKDFAHHLLDIARNTPSASVPWLHIWAVMGDLPWAGELADKLTEVIRTTDFPSLVTSVRL